MTFDYKEYYQKNKERIKANVKEWRKANPNYLKEYYYAHKEKARGYQYKWRRANKKKLREQRIKKKIEEINEREKEEHVGQFTIVIDIQV